MSSLILWDKSQILGVSRAVQAQKKYLVYIFFSNCSAANSKSKKGHNCAKNILRVTSPIGMSSPVSKKTIWMKCQALFCGKNHRYLGSVGQCRPKKNILYIFFSQIARLQILSWKRGITVPKIFWGLPPLLVWVPLSIMNNQSEFQVNIFSNDKDITKCPSFCTTTTQTTPELWQYLIVFFENSRAKNN